MSSSFFTWEPKYQLNIQQMDDEHKTLIQIMNDIYEMNNQKKDFNNILTKVAELARWTELHFKNEEAYFSSIVYAKTEAHKMIHKELLKKFGEHVETMKIAQKVPDSFFMFLKVWLSAHILGVDTGYAQIDKQKVV